jgi:hypothetical protein
MMAPALRVAAATALMWALATLAFLPPKTHEAKKTDPTQLKHVVLVLDVSPSMKLKDAGPNQLQTRAERAATLLQSFFERVPMEQVRLSVIATYTSAKPVVIDTRDVGVVKNILTDLPLSHAFAAGSTDLFSGLAEAARVAAEQSLAMASTAKDAACKMFGEAMVRVSDGDSDFDGGGAAPGEHGDLFPLPPMPMPVAHPVNDEGALVALGTDEYAFIGHDGRLKFYCGRHLGTDAIPGSDGRCGPTGGPACASCSRFQTRLVNDEGDIIAFGTPIGCQGTFYCGKHKGPIAIPDSDGRCGPNDGPACQSCSRLLQAFTNRLVPPYCYRPGMLFEKTFEEFYLRYLLTHRP